LNESTRHDELTTRAPILLSLSSTGAENPPRAPLYYM
jgi:hypothetical protein